MSNRQKAIDLLKQALELLQAPEPASNGHAPLPVGTLVDMNGEVGRVMAYEAIVQLGTAKEPEPTAGITYVSSEQLVQKPE